MSYSGNVAPLRGPDNRRWPRIPLWLAASVRTSFDQHNAKLLNVSRSGALIETTSPLPSGTHVSVNCGALQANGRIVWSEDRKAGIKFADLICDSAIANQLARSDAAARLREFCSKGQVRTSN